MRSNGNERIVGELEARPPMSFWRELRTSILGMLKPRILVSYGIAIIAFSVLSLLLPYQSQVYLSITAGIAVALLLFLSNKVSSRDFNTLDMVFVGGIVFLFIALFPKELLIGFFPAQETLRDFRHVSRILSIVLTGLYVTLKIFQTTHNKSHVTSVKSLSSFFSICSTTVSSELCSCLHPIPFLDAFLGVLGIADLLLNRVKLGFVIVMTTLIHQTNSTYRTHKSRGSS